MNHKIKQPSSLRLKPMFRLCHFSSQDSYPRSVIDTLSYLPRGFAADDPCLFEKSVTDLGLDFF